MSVNARGLTVYSLGHSTHSMEEFVALLQEFGIELLADIRSLPGSRRLPHFNKENLAAILPREGIRYMHLPALGGLRRSAKGFESPNTGLTSPAFRSYADYMAGEEFRQGVRELLAMARQQRTAVMCAEVLFWRCHRRLLCDYLTVHGAKVIHIFGHGKSQPHAMTPEAVRTSRGQLVYPPAKRAG